MRKEYRLVIVVLVLAIVGYYSMFISEVPLFGPRVLSSGSGSQVATTTTKPTGDLPAPVPTTPSEIPSAGEGPKCYGARKVPCCTDPCFPNTRTCPITTPDKGDGTDCEEQDATYSCQPKPCYGPDKLPNTNDDEKCCVGECYDQNQYVCCGEKKRYAVDITKHCCADGRYISECGCCRYQVQCTVGGGGMGTSDPPFCFIQMSPTSASTLGYSCDGSSYIYIDDILRGLSVDYGTNVPSGTAECTRLHEFTHMNQFINGMCVQETRICEMEQNAFAAQYFCLDNFVRRSDACTGCPEACDGVNGNPSCLTCSAACKEAKFQLRSVSLTYCMTSKICAATNYPPDVPLVGEYLCMEIFAQCGYENYHLFPQLVPVCQSYCKNYADEDTSFCV